MISKLQLESIYRDLETPLFNFALRWVFDAGLAEELVQKSFVRIWNRRDKVQPETIKSLLYKSLQNLALNEIRKRKVRESLKILDWLWPQEQLEEDLILAQDLQLMRTALEKLPYDLREVLLLSQYSDLSYDEIATTLGLPSGTVASRKSRALEFLRKEMENL